MDSELSVEFEVNVGMHQGSELLHFVFAVVVDGVTEFAREGTLCQLLYADDLVMMNERIRGLKNMFLKWKEAFVSMGLKVSLGKTKVMVCGGITMDGISKSKVDPFGVCYLRVKANSVMCLQCDKWIHGRCAGMKNVTPKFSRNFTCRRCEGNIVEVVEQEKNLFDEVETVGEFTCLGDRVSADGGCVTAVTVKTRCGLVRFRECGELL